MRFTLIVSLVHLVLWSGLSAQNEAPVFLMGSASGSDACSGTLYDAGGPNGDYQNDLDQVFTICPDSPGSCIAIDLLNFDLELGTDSLIFYTGSSANAPILAILSHGSAPDAAFPILSASSCVTVRFVSDGSVTQPGFALNWNCQPASCTVSDVASATPMPMLPFDSGLRSTCDGAATFGGLDCPGADFVNGPEYVFVYDAPGGSCLSLSLEGAAFGTGILVLDGVPGAPGTSCVATGLNGSIAGADTRIPGRYYIVVANNSGCTDFRLLATTDSCVVSPALANALCDPVNNCLSAPDEPVFFQLVDGFKDLNQVVNINSGCWLGDGLEPDYFWFTVQAAADGKIGFLTGSKDGESDLDLNVWGPFSAEEVCGSPATVLRFIEKNQPIRSSWSTTGVLTGLVDAHPLTGVPVLDELDCKNGIAGAPGDDFVSRIAAKKGEVYVVLLNDWGNEVGASGIFVDFSPSDPGVMAPMPVTVVRGDTTICPGGSAPLLLENTGTDILWEDPNGTLSCTDCPNPIARPATTTTYKAHIVKNCSTTSIEIAVQVLGLPDFPNITVCRGEDFRVFAGPAYDKAIYNWQFSGFLLEGTYLDQGDVLFRAKEAGTSIVVVNLVSGDCSFSESFSVTVLPPPAAVVDIAPDNRICRGDAVNLGGTSREGYTYNWSSVPSGFSAATANPQVQPAATTTYFLEVSNGLCPLPSRDSVTIAVDTLVEVVILSDTTVCEGTELQLSAMPALPGVIYEWTGPGVFDDPTRPDARMVPENSGTFTLNVVNGTCVYSAAFELTMIPSAVRIADGQDELRVCEGESATLTTSTNPAGSPISWYSSDGAFLAVVADELRIQPTQPVTRYLAQVSNGQCVATDTITVFVDSLPADLSIAPADTTVCEGSLLILKTPTYDPENFPDITFSWGPSDAGFESPDSLLNMVLTADITRTLYRATVNGACVDTTTAVINVDTIPEISITPTDTLLCYPEEIRLVVNLVGDLEDKEWTPADGVSCKDCLTPTVRPTSKTTYTFQGKAGECPVSVSTTIDVEQIPPFEFPKATTICPGETVTLNTRPLSGISYVWTSTDPTFGTILDPFPQVTPAQTTTYFLSIKEFGSDCPPYEASITINVLDLASVSLSASDDFICPGESVTLNANVSGGTPTDVFIWTDNFGRELNDTDASVTVRPSQTTTYTLTYIQSDRCNPVILSTTVEVDPLIIVDITTNEEDQNFRIDQGDKVTLSAAIETSNTGPLTLQWQENGVAIPGATGESIEVQPLSNDIVYTLLVTSPSGCTASAEVVFTVVEPVVEIPTAFTPNGDGLNDRFTYFTSGNLELESFEVFNRWGQKVYSNQTPDTGWDGEFKGKPAVSDVYIYIIVLRRLDGAEIVKKGEVTLIR
ncbi:MAG: gliding motility-associated C-terminal domain-containing protein [Saprospiraceae bacterium]|nr:gliding motility-associated C-terminal domain-containing protein [Saprospiraceae bacterium]